MPPQTIHIDTSRESDGLFSSLFGKRIDERTYSKFLADYDAIAPDDELTIVLTTEGGDMKYSVLIANAVANHKGRTVALVPKYAFSGGTVIALMCDEIHMFPNASLGPVDLQVYLPVKSVIPTMRSWKDANWFCGTVHAVLDSCQSDYLDRLRSLLELKHEQKNEVGAILDFFYHKFNHSTPIFQRDVPASLSLKVRTVDRSDTTEKTVNVETMGGGEDMMRMMSMLAAGGGGGGAGRPNRRPQPQPQQDVFCSSDDEL